MGSGEAKRVRPVKISTVLKRAMRRITPKARWATEYYALNKNGREVEPNSTAACRWCGVGALLAEFGESSYRLGGDSYWKARKMLADDTPFDCGRLVRLNDGPNGHRRVLARYRKAIAAAEKAERAEK